MTSPGFLRDTRAATAAEFALMVPLMLLFLLGIIDAGGYGYQINVTEKAAQMGVRYAVVTDVVASDLATKNYTGNTSCTGTLASGDTICKAALGTVQCGNTGNCTCVTTPCPLLTRNSAAFDNVAARIGAIAPWVKPANIKIEYSSSGLGYAGDPNMDIAPVVTVRIDGITYFPLSGYLLNATIQMPPVFRSLPIEDASGVQAN